MTTSNTLFTIKFSYKGQTATIDNISLEATTSSDLLSKARASFDVANDIILRLIFKGKTIAQETIPTDHEDDTTIINNNHPAFQQLDIKIPKNNTLKIIVMGSTTASNIQQLNALKSDPLMRGFEDEKSTTKKSTKSSAALSTYWGPKYTQQNSQYKFCKFQECTDASFGSRPGSSTPHAFKARDLLHQLATDPGIISILTKRELLVATLGEMDPIDDRLMQAKQSEGACLLGYNTNHGMRIDVKLRTDDLAAFRPYNELASTLIHELSHNWVGEHNTLFWTNYGQMRVEYLYVHARLMNGSVFVNGKRTATLAGVTDMISPSSSSSNNGSSSNVGNVTSYQTTVMDNICQSVIQELAREMAQHQLPVQLVIPAILTFSKELLAESKKEDAVDESGGGYKLGSALDKDTNESNANTDNATNMSVRERALAAAEKRAREQLKKKDEPSSR